MKILFFNSVFLILFLMSILCYPLNTAAHGISTTNTKYSKSVFVQDAKHFAQVGLGLVAAPFTFDRRDWAQIGLTAGGMALLFTEDKNIKNFALRNQNKLNDILFYADNYYWRSFGILAQYQFFIFIIDGYIKKSEKIRANKAIHHKTRAEYFLNVHCYHNKFLDLHTS